MLLGVVDADHGPLDSELLEKLQVLIAGIGAGLNRNLNALRAGIVAGHGLHGILLGLSGHELSPRKGVGAIWTMRLY